MNHSDFSRKMNRAKNPTEQNRILRDFANKNEDRFFPIFVMNPKLEVFDDRRQVSKMVSPRT